MRRQPFPVPYGLLIVLGAYALGVLGYVWATHWNSPEYLAAEHCAAAAELLGVDDGRRASREQLSRAYAHYLEAARLMPRVKLLHERTEAMRWRFDERRLELDHDLQMRAEAMAALWQRLQREEEPLLVVGARDRGWQPAQVLEGPARAVTFSLPGALLIVALWAYLRFSGRKVRADRHERELRGLEDDVKRLEGGREAPTARTRRSGPPKR